MLYIITDNLLLIEVVDIIPVLKEVLIAVTVDELEILPVIIISVNIIAGLEHILLTLGSSTPSHAYNVQLLPGGISLKHLVNICWLLLETLPIR